MTLMAVVEFFNFSKCTSPGRLRYYIGSCG
jgi:hypothetical protein